ncbi:P-loop NTPase [Candidatus Pacearchaeota archaeon]|nr:P-loop NTPase [Candidatus Pacearchaeota archaeon]
MNGGLVNGNTKVLGIVSAKGGVGKTTTVSNIGAAAVTLFKKNTLILDANINTGNIGLALGLTYHPVSINKIIKDPVTIMSSVHKHKCGLHVIPSSLVKEKGKIDTNGLNKKLKKLKSYDLILLDSSPGVEDDAKLAIKASDALLLVLTPDFPTVATAMKTINLAKKLKKPILGVILNKVRGKKYEVSTKELEASFGLPVLASIPYDENIEEAVARRLPVVIHSPKSSSSISFKKLSANLLGKKYIKKSLRMKLAEFFGME